MILVKQAKVQIGGHVSWVVGQSKLLTELPFQLAAGRRSVLAHYVLGSSLCHLQANSQ